MPKPGRLGWGIKFQKNDSSVAVLPHAVDVARVRYQVTQQQRSLSELQGKLESLGDSGMELVDVRMGKGSK